MTDEIERLRAELAAAQLAADLIAQQGTDLCTKCIKERDAVAIRLENALNEGAQRRAERDTLRAELTAARNEHENLILMWRNETAEIEKALTVVEAERDALRAENETLRDAVNGKLFDKALKAFDEIERLSAERDALRELLREAAEKLQPISALVDMTPSGFPDHDICPIRLGMARDLRELRARIDAALKGDGKD